MSGSSEYNGWPNYATWGVAVVTDNDQGLYQEREEVVANAVLTAELSIEVDDQIKEWVESRCRNGGDAGLASQMISAGLSQVDWCALTDAWASENERNDVQEAWAALRSAAGRFEVGA